MILVTGGLGFIGSSLARRLLGNGEDLVIVDSLFNSDSKQRLGLVDEDNVMFINKDVRELELSDLSGLGVDLVYHLAAQISVGGSFQQPVLDSDINVRGTVNVLDLARELECPVVFASSSTVYGVAGVPTPESAGLEPISPYGVSKLAGEYYCGLYASEYNIPVSVFRIFNVFGPGGFKGVIPDFVRKLSESPGKLEVLGSGEQRKDYIFIDDVVSALVQHPEGTFNLGTGESFTVLELADLIIDCMGLKDVRVETGHQNWPGDVKETQADISKLKQTGWNPETSLKEGIQKTVNYLTE